MSISNEIILLLDLVLVNHEQAQDDFEFVEQVHANDVMDLELIMDHKHHLPFQLLLQQLPNQLKIRD
jgi:hypothetical protein